MRGDAPPAAAAPLTVIHGGISYSVEPGSRLTFGRGMDCTIRLGRQPDGDYDRRLSRDAGYFEVLGPLWFVWATGNSLDVHDDLGGATPVVRGNATAIARPRVTVTMHGAKNYDLDVRYPDDALPSAVSYLPRRSSESPTENPRDPKPSHRQKVVYVAKLAPMLTGGVARSHRATAALLRSGGDPTYTDDAVRNMWAVWVTKCVDAGFPGLTRETGLDDLSADRAMFRELRRRGLLTPDDLRLLPGSRGPD